MAKPFWKTCFTKQFPGLQAERFTGEFRKITTHRNHEINLDDRIVFVFAILATVGYVDNTSCSICTDIGTDHCISSYDHCYLQLGSADSKHEESASVSLLRLMFLNNDPDSHSVSVWFTPQKPFRAKYMCLL